MQSVTGAGRRTMPMPFFGRPRLLATTSLPPVGPIRCVTLLTQLSLQRALRTGFATLYKTRASCDRLTPLFFAGTRRMRESRSGGFPLSSSTRSCGVWSQQTWRFSMAARKTSDKRPAGDRLTSENPLYRLSNIVEISRRRLQIQLVIVAKNARVPLGFPRGRATKLNYIGSRSGDVDNSCSGRLWVEHQFFLNQISSLCAA